MGLARHEREMAARGEGCLGKAAADEPVFILRAQDVLAEARALAEAMRRWPTRKNPD